MGLLRKAYGNTVVLAAAWRRRGMARRPHADIENQRDRRVRSLVRFAAKTVPFYRDWFDQHQLDPRDIRRAEDLAQLPLLEKSTVRDEPERFRSESRRGRTAIRFNTSGSTGAPLVFYHDRRSLLANIAYGECERSVITGLVGKSLGYRTLRFNRDGGTLSGVQSFCNENTLIPGRPSRDRVSVNEPLDSVIEAIREKSVPVLGGYGSYLEMLFRYIHERGIDIPLPRVIDYGADGMTAPGRQLISDAFGIPIVASYNAVECFKIGFQCGAGPAYHLYEDLCHLRVVNQQGNSVPTGSPGHIVISNLVNRGTVLLNYRIGDLGTLADTPCQCGRQFALLEDLEGRVEDMLFLPNGDFLHPRAIWGVLRKVDGLLRYQFIEHTPERFELGLVTTSESAYHAIVDRAVPELKHLLGASAHLDVARCDELTPDASGKFRPVICRWQGREAG